MYDDLEMHLYLIKTLVKYEMSIHAHLFIL